MPLESAAAFFGRNLIFLVHLKDNETPHVSEKEGTLLFINASSETFLRW